MSKKETTHSELQNNFIPKSKHYMIKPKEKTSGGIYIPENAQAINDSIMNEPQLIIHTASDSEHKVGDRIIVEPHVLQIVNYNDEVYFLIPDYRYFGKVLNYIPKDDKKTKSKIELL